MKSLLSASFAIILALALASHAHAAGGVVLSVNAGDAPVGSGTIWNAGNSPNEEVGWLYTVPSTPGQTYTVTNLGTEFGTTSSQIVTAEIFSGSPTTTLHLLSSGTLTAVANTMEYATLGTPVVFTAGSTYFIAFQDVSHLGRDVTTVAGATSLTADYYDFSNPGNNSFSQTSTSGTTNHPILSFEGTAGNVAVPEPSTYAMFLLSFAGLFFIRRLRTQRVR